MSEALKKEEILVQLDFTPNPDTLKYSTNQILIPSGAANFTSAKSAEGKSPLAEALFKDSLISAVMIGTNFVTITVQDQSTLQDLNERTIGTIREFILSGGKAVLEQPKVEGAALTEIERKIIEILDRDVRPAVAMDGGDISFEKFEDGFVFLKMQGSCSGCPSSLMTLKMGVETRLKDAIPEVIEVIPV
ncbi:MAG: iron transporter [Bacteriovoracaceae bacterium]|nr:iron transporter [Bacteriovoracaceae bacterium]